MYSESLTHSHSTAALCEDGFDGLLLIVNDDSFFHDAETHSTEQISTSNPKLPKEHILKLSYQLPMNIVPSRNDRDI